MSAVATWAPPTLRLGWSLSPLGDLAACKVDGADGALRLEVRRPFCDRTRPLVQVEGLHLSSLVLAHDDGTVVVCPRTHDGWQPAQVETDGTLVHWAQRVPLAARIHPGPPGTLDVHLPDAEGTRISRAGPGGQVDLAHVPFRVLSSHPWGEDVVVLDVLCDSGYSRAVRLDLATGEVDDFFCVSDRTDDRVVAVVPSGDLVVVSTTATGEPRVGWGRLSEQRISFPDAGSSDRAMSALAISADGERLVLVEDRGVQMPMRLVDLRTGSWRALTTTPLVIAGRGVLRDHSLLVPVGDPRHAGTVAQLTLDGSDVVRFDDDPVAGAIESRVVELPGPGGALEAMVYGDIEHALSVVIALHGGPFAAWRAGHNPLFDELVAAGAAVVAPNIRGSIGYGRPHAHAITDRWGEVDTEDVLAVLSWVRRQRPAHAAGPVVMGESYGAYLALLCAAVAPVGSWSGCVAMSGFTSGARIAALNTSVSQLVRRFGGQRSPDLLRLVGDITVPVLLIHGQQDQTVPAAESRELAECLRASGACVDLVIDPAADHDLLGSASSASHRRRVTAFVQDRQTPPPGRR